MSGNVSKLCSADGSDALCSRVYDWTGNQWLANSSYWVIVKPMRIIAVW